MIDRLLFLFLWKVAVVLICGHTRTTLLVILYVHPGKWLQSGRPSTLVGEIPCSSRNTAVLLGRKMW